jgi:hypothetical protein
MSFNFDIVVDSSGCGDVAKAERANFSHALTSEAKKNFEFFAQQLVGSARVSRVGEGVLAIADFSYVHNRQPSAEILESLFRRDAETKSPRRPLPQAGPAHGERIH